MQAIKLTIPGKFWDSQIYSSYLFLFGRSGNISILDWRKVFENFIKDKYLQITAEIAFFKGGLPYTIGSREFLKDDDIKSILLKKFENLAKLQLTIPVNGSSNYIISNQSNPLPFPHSDSEVYYRRIYVGTRSGVYSSNCDGNSSQPIASKIDKQWDAPVFNLSASYETLALAAGSEGLFEFRINRRDDDFKQTIDEPRLISNNHCTLCDWTFYSIYASSHIKPAFLADFSRIKDSNSKSKNYVRKFEEVISSNDLFQSKGFSWGGHDKLYQYHNNVVEVIRYSPRNKKQSHSSFHSDGEIKLDSWKGDVVSARAVPFGMVIECDNAIVVVRSDNIIETIPGEPVNWRVFPRSKYYKNQLHIIYDDKMEIWSFNHDYFVEQETKRAGTFLSIEEDF